MPIGFAELDCRNAPQVRLTYIGVVPEWLGQGLGKYLVGAILEIAWSHDPESVLLSTCDLDHPRAIALYQKFGFQLVRQEQRSVPNPWRTGLYAFT